MGIYMRLKLDPVKRGQINKAYSMALNTKYPRSLPSSYVCMFAEYSYIWNVNETGDVFLAGTTFTGWLFQLAFLWKIDETLPSILVRNKTRRLRFNRLAILFVIVFFVFVHCRAPNICHFIVFLIMQ